jgi:hypothetical protein
VKKRVRLIIALGVGCFGLLIPAFSSADGPKKSRIEAFLYLSWSSGGEPATYKHDYPLDFADALPGAHGFQTLTIERKWGEGIQGGLSFFITDRFGLKFSLSYNRHKLSGGNSPYEIEMKYITYYPPYWDKFVATRNMVIEWMPTEGRLESLGFFLNAQFRFPLSEMATGTVSIGPGIFCVSGRFSALGYHEFWLGGYGSLFYNDFLLMMKIPASWKTCLNTDLEISLRLSKLVSLAARIAYMAAGNISRVPSIDRILSYYSLDEVSTETYLRVKDYLNFKPLVLNPSALSLNLGLKLQL